MSSRICEGMLVLNQPSSILRGLVFNITCVMRMTRVWDRSCPKLHGPSRLAAVYQSDFDTQAGTYNSTIQHGGHSSLASLGHSLQDLLPDDAPASPE